MFVYKLRFFNQKSQIVFIENENHYEILPEKSFES